MTAVLAPATTGTRPTALLLVESRRREMQLREALFDATRPADPDWCDKTCNDVGHVGDAVLHCSPSASLTAATDLGRDPDRPLYVRSWRHDSLDEPTTSGVEISDDPTRPFFVVDGIFLTPGQARTFADLLRAAADRAEPEYEVPAEQVRVGDEVPVDGGWRYVYGVDWDEPSNLVQIFTTVDPAAYPEIGTVAEKPQSLRPGILVRVRRGGAR